MIRAAILPYARVPGGACCVVVVHDGPVVLEREDVPVGHLATVNGRITRIVGPAEVAAVVARVVEIVRTRGVERSRVEWPSGDGVEATRAKVIAAGINAALGAWWPEVVAIVTAAPGDIAARLRALMEDEGPGVGGETSSPALAPLPVVPECMRSKPQHERDGPATTGASPEPTPAPLPAQAPKVGRRVLAVDPGSKHVAAVVLERLPVKPPLLMSTAPGDSPVHEVGDLSRPHAPDTETKPPSETRASVGVLSKVSPRYVDAHVPHPTTLARHVASLSLTIGRDVPLRRPKVITRKDGTVITKTTRHEVTDEDLDELLRTLATFAAEHDVDEAAVEVATFAHKGAGAFLLRSNEIGGEVRGWLRAAELPVRRVSSRVWRARVRAMYDGGERSGDDGQLQAVRKRQARDEGVQEEHSEGVPGADGVSARTQDARGNVDADGGSLDSRVRALVADLPPAADAHILDASGAALWALAPEPSPEVAPPAKPRAPRAQGGGKASAWTPVKAAWLKRKRDAAKRARGCIGCVGQHHQATCPIEVARLAKVAPSMRGNQNAARGAKV